MQIEEINKFIDEEIIRLERLYSQKSNEELTLAMTIKLGEEVGELFNEILAHNGFQRKEKLDRLDEKEIEKEIADVIITTFIIARRFGINPETAIKEKMEIIQTRKYN